MALTLTQDDINAIAVAVATAVLQFPANKIYTDTDGYVIASAILLSPGAQQNVRDALLLPAGGEAAAGSIDALLAAIVADTGTALPATLAAIRGKTDALGAGQVTVVAPVAANGDASIDAGYDYYAADGRALAWTDATPASWPDLTDATATFYAGGLTVTGAITNPTGPATITVELSRTQTAALSAGLHQFRIVVALANTHQILQLRGALTVRG